MLSFFYSVAVNADPPAGPLSVLFAGHSQTEPKHEVGPQMLDHFLIHYIVSGKGSFRSNEQHYSLAAGDCFVIFPGELVSYVADELDPWSYRWVAFTGDKAPQLVAQVGLSTELPIVTTDDSHELNRLFVDIEQVLRRGGKHCSLRAEGYLRLILAEYNDHLPSTAQVRSKSEAEMQVDKAIRWLTLQYARPLTINELANDIGYHRTHFSKLFKEHTGRTPSQFLLKIRMERAAVLLKQSEMTIQQIASSVGYSDALYFSRQFKQWYGVAPSAYRTKYRNK